jgi:hypothetical protein
VEAFCEGLRGLAQAGKLTAWNQQMNALELTGLGDPIPDALVEKLGANRDRFDHMIQAAREISASQIFGSEDRKEIHQFFVLTCDFAGVDATLPIVFLDPDAGSCWGEAVSDSRVLEWTKENKRIKCKG